LRQLVSTPIPVPAAGWKHTSDRLRGVGAKCCRAGGSSLSLRLRNLIGGSCMKRM
jgi:hypothetical protein